jgi:hypothetical protein
MSMSITPFHTVTFEHHVPGEPVEMAAVSYNLQYTKPLVEELVTTNPPQAPELHVVHVSDQELVRVNLFGQDPGGRRGRICVVGVGDDEARATGAAHSAWFDYHASVLFTSKVGTERTHTLALQHPVPGTPPQRAAIVGVVYDLGYMRPLVDAAVAKNAPTHDEVQVVECGELTLMRVNLYGRHPLESSRRVCVGGIADRHFRGVAAAEHAWAKYHTSLLLGAQALSLR